MKPISNKKEVALHLQAALKEVGSIRPWWSKEDGLFVFEHKAYPMVVYAGSTKIETKNGYTRALTEFIKERLKGNVAQSVEKITSGRGGARVGAGRPVGTKKTPTLRISLPKDVAQWVAEDRAKRINMIRQIMG